VRLIVPSPRESSTLSDTIKPWRDARLLAVRVVSAAGDRAGDVAAMAAVVVGQRAAVDEIDEFPVTR
jgi:hypothetical protein